MEALPEPVEPKVEGMDDHGWSNSPPAEGAAEDVHPEVAEPEVVEPGFSNAKAVKGDETTTSSDESSQPAKKTAAKKSAAKKG